MLQPAAQGCDVIGYRLLAGPHQIKTTAGIARFTEARLQPLLVILWQHLWLLLPISLLMSRLWTRQPAQLPAVAPLVWLSGRRVTGLE